MNAKDFYKGQKVWVRLDGRNVRHRKQGKDLIEEWEIVSVGRKYISASPDPDSPNYAVQFDLTNNLKQKDDGYTADYVLYLDKDAAFDEVERKELLRWFRKFFDFPWNKKISVDQLRRAKEILEEN